MMLIAPFSKVNLSSGEREDRANRWVFIALSLIALASAIVPPYTDRIGLWTIDGETTRWIGVMRDWRFAAGPALRSVCYCWCRSSHEERLLRGHFGAEYDAYVKRTWRLIPGIY
jgi:protein-S-isoprenylcysteine O-methyltransferase Ste14